MISIRRLGVDRSGEPCRAVGETQFLWWWVGLQFQGWVSGTISLWWLNLSVLQGSRVGGWREEEEAAGGGQEEGPAITWVGARRWLIAGQQEMMRGETSDILKGQHDCWWIRNLKSTEEKTQKEHLGFSNSQYQKTEIFFREKNEPETGKTKLLFFSFWSGKWFLHRRTMKWNFWVSGVENLSLNRLSTDSWPEWSWKSHWTMFSILILKEQ